MNYDKLKEKIWSFNDRGGRNQDRVIVKSEGIHWQSWSGTPQTDYDLENQHSQDIDDFILDGTKHRPFHGPIPKRIKDGMLLYLAQYLSGEKSIKEMWEVDSKFIRLDADHVVAGTGRGSFPGGDLANSWPIKSFNQKTAMKALSAFDLEIIKEVLISIKMRNVLKENEGLH